MEEFITSFKNLKKKRPLIHAITNYVTINDCANILLAAGASPAMCESMEETFEFAKISNALYFNIGTFTKEHEIAMLLGIRGAEIKGAPVVLDPVGCGAIPRRIDYINKLKEFGKISVIRGNMGEIKALLGVAAKVQGVDSLDDGSDGIRVCKELAQKYNCIVAASGKTDIITDGEKVCMVENGTDMLTKITGAGCMLGALTAGFCGANEDLLTATAAAHLVMAIAGELALETDRGKNPGSFRTALIDQIYLIDEKILTERGKFRWE